MALRAKDNPTRRVNDKARLESKLQANTIAGSVTRAEALSEILLTWKGFHLIFWWLIESMKEL